MKLLIYGIDGGDLEIMKIFKDQMPFLMDFIEKNDSIHLEEDLFNRGWVEILTGKNGSETRGFYMAPKLDGTHKFTTSFKLSELDNREDVKYIWELAEANDMPYCVMNVPTTTPVPKKGKGKVIVGSAGGGLNRIEGIPQELVSRDELISFLEKRKYIVDIRIPNEEINSTDGLFEQLSKKETTRTDVFIDLCNQESAKFGFLVNRGNTIVEYLSRFEIESYKEEKVRDKWIWKLLESHFKELDNQIRKLYENLKPEVYITSISKKKS